MNALPESLNAIGGLDWIHLVFLWLTIMSVQLSPMLRRMLARISNAVFKTKFNTNGVTTDDLAAVNKRLDAHEKECDIRHSKIQSDIRGLKEDISDIKGDMSAMKTDILWIKQLLSYRKGGSDE